MDIAIAYLNGFMDEKVYMRPPSLPRKYLRMIARRRGTEDAIGCKAIEMMERIDDYGDDAVCRLNRAIYGLKQAGRQWHQRFDSTLQTIGLKPITSDPWVYCGRIEGREIRLLIHVDDVLLVCKNEGDLTLILTLLRKEFEVKDLGEVNYLLGIELYPSGVM